MSIASPVDRPSMYVKRSHNWSISTSMSVGDKFVYTEIEVDSQGTFAELQLDKPFMT